MNYKIVVTGSKTPDVLFFRDRDEYGNDCVEIRAIGIMEGEMDMFAIEQIAFKGAESAKLFILSVDKSYAEAWCEQQGIKYQKP